MRLNENMHRWLWFCLHSHIVFKGCRTASSSRWDIWAALRYLPDLEPSDRVGASPWCSDSSPG